MRRPLIRVAIGIATVAAVVIPATGVAASGAGPLYNSTVAPKTVGNLPSVGGEAYSFNELGNEVNLTGTHLGKVTVEMSSWGCQTGGWFADNCGTVGNATFSQSVTFNIYGPPSFGSDVPGALIATQTATFNMPYRPSANFAHCNAGNGKAGEWWDKALASCFNGKAFDIVFNFGPIVLPTTDVVYGITYNTTHYGYSPVGESAACFGTSAGCPYDSLNIALSQDPTNVSAGSDRYPGTLYQNAAYGGDYCNNGAAGTGFFRIDSPNVDPSNCPNPNGGWSVNGGGAPWYIPAVEFGHSS